MRPSPHARASRVPRSPRSLGAAALVPFLLCAFGGCGRPESRRDGPPPLRLGALAAPTVEERAAGPAVEVGIAGEIVVTCREDGSLTLTSPGTSRRVAPPEGERFRHVAAWGHRALALTGRGIVHAIDLDRGTTTALAGRTQGTARLVMASDLVGYVGIEGGALFRTGPDSTEVETLWASGAEPVSALAADAGRVFVAHADGTVEWTPHGPTSRATLLTDVPSTTAIAADAEGVALGDSGGTIRWAALARGSDHPGAWVTVRLEGPVRSLASLPGHLLAALRPHRLVLLRLPALERVSELEIEGLEIRSLVADAEGRRVRMATSDPAGVREIGIEVDAVAGVTRK